MQQRQLSYLSVTMKSIVLVHNLFNKTCEDVLGLIGEYLNNNGPAIAQYYYIRYHAPKVAPSLPLVVVPKQPPPLILPATVIPDDINYKKKPNKKQLKRKHVKKIRTKMRDRYIKRFYTEEKCDEWDGCNE